MTFSILGADGLGGFGIAIASSSPAVAARCAFARCGVGCAASQNLTDPRLGDAMLDGLQQGLDADEALAGVLRSAPGGTEYRQLMVLDSTGGAAHFTGESALATYAASVGERVVAAGNLLADAAVPSSMVRDFEHAQGDLEARLLGALLAGLRAGGERSRVQSAGLVVVRSAGWAETDLRVDWHDDPIDELARLLERWSPLRDDYVQRGLRPNEALLADLPDP